MGGVELGGGREAFRIVSPGNSKDEVREYPLGRIKSCSLHIVPAIGIDNNTSRRVPDLHRFVRRTGSDELPIRRPGNRAYHVGMSTIGIPMISGRGIPDLHRFVRRTGSDPLTIGRPHYRVYAR